MNVLAYVLVFLGFVLILGIGGAVCDNDCVCDGFERVKRFFGAVFSFAAEVLMIPGMILCNAFYAFTGRETD